MSSDDDWMSQGTCSQSGFADLWFSPLPTDQRDASEICLKTCPVQELCLDWAMTIERYYPDRWQRHGIWGGMTPAERRHLAKATSR